MKKLLNSREAVYQLYKETIYENDVVSKSKSGYPGTSDIDGLPMFMVVMVRKQKYKHSTPLSPTYFRYFK